MSGNYFTKPVVSSRKPLSSKQRAALLFSLLGQDGFNSLTAYLSDREITQLRKAMKSIKDRIDVEDDIEVLESLQKYGEAVNAWPSKQSSAAGYRAKNFDNYGQYQEPVPEKGLSSMGLNAEDVARVLSMWLQDDKEN